jgi:anhydro-N-acetylmuramic acid kinase
MHAEAWIGLMSGTSLDGVDAVLARADDRGALRGVGHVHHAFEPGLRAELLALNRSGADELHRAALATNGLMRAYAAAVHELLARAGCTAQQVQALGAHGQTVRHRPGAFDGTGYTLQLMNGALLAELTGIAVACDFRSRDVAAGGQGAPLVPAFHAACFAQPGEAQAVLNVGGIANLTLLGADGRVGGFDCGPGNVLMDTWVQQWRGQSYDADGTWAAQGRVDAGLLAVLLEEPFLALAPPKSTGRDLFTPDWLLARLAQVGRPLEAVDVMATLVEFTASAAAQALRREAPGSARLVVCGGGAFNTQLMGRLAALSGLPVVGSGTLGVPPDQVEALAFAWLARARVRGEPGNLPAVTGAAGPRVLGAIHPAR